MDQEDTGVDAVEAAAFRDLLEQDHAQAPPVRRWRDGTDDRLRSRIRCRLERSDDVEVEFGKPCRSEAGDRQVERLAGPDVNVTRSQVPMPQSDLGKRPERASNLQGETADGRKVGAGVGLVGERSTFNVLADVVEAIIPATSGNQRRHVITRQPLQKCIDGWIGLVTVGVQCEHRRSVIIAPRSHKALAYPSWCAQSPI